ncbi:MAG: TIM barrel protein [Verrucomicrobiae bacterium]|nr:TIM barrel protein [Verrucomicrobiae bacterium]
MNQWNRRDWIGAVGSVATGALMPRVAFGETKAESVCGIGIGTYGLQSLDLEAAIRLVGQTGYDAIEITVFPGFTGDPDSISSKKRKIVGNFLADSHLRVCALMADLHPSADEAAHREKTEAFRKTCQLGRDLAPDHPPLVQTVLGGKDWESSKNLFRDRVGDWLRVATEEKTMLAVKPHRGHAMSRPEEAIWLFQQLGESPWLKMVYDYSHFYRREPEMSIAATVGESLPWTSYVASKDAVLKDGKVVFALTGEGGEFEHAEIVKAFYAGGYRGDFCCEVSGQIWKTQGYDPVEATGICYRNLAEAFERAGVPRPAKSK